MRSMDFIAAENYSPFNVNFLQKRSYFASRPFWPAFLFLSAALLITPVLASAETFDWRSIGGSSFVTPVKSQGSSGMCSAFASVAALESKYMITRNDPSYVIDLSELQLDGAGIVDFTNGGYIHSSFNYFISTGEVLESVCPWTGSECTSWPPASGWDSHVCKMDSYTDGYWNLATIKSMLKSYGPLGMYCQVDNDFYGNGSGSYRGEHSILMVGFVDDLSVSGGGYFVFKNSWGTGGGYSGYYRMTYSTVAGNRQQFAITSPAYFNGPTSTLNWDTSTSSGYQAGSGTWSTSNSNWSSTGTSLSSWSNGEVAAVFSTGGESYTVNVGSNVSAQALTFNSGASGYTFNGGSLTITSSGMTCNESVNFNTPLTAGANQTWTIASGKTLTMGGTLNTHISTLTVNCAGDMIVTGTIRDLRGESRWDGLLTAHSGGLTKSGTGTLTFAGANTYTGDTTITSGLIKLGSASGSMSPYSTVAMSANTTLDVTNVPSTLGALSGSSGTASVLIGSATLTIGGNNKSTSFSGIISGSGGLVKIGSGVQTLVGNNTYEGGTTFNGGYLAVSALSKLGTGALTFDGGGLKFTSSFDPTLRPLTINSGGAAFDTNNLGIVCFYPLTGSGGVTKAGSGYLAYRNPCTYAGDTTINTGSLRTYAANLLPNGSGKGNVTIAAGATLDLFSYNQTINGLSGQGTVDNTSGTSAYTISVGGNDTNSTFDGKVQNTTGSLGINKIGTGTFTLTGPNTYNGPTTITQGTLKLGVPVTVAHRWSFNNNLLDSVGGSNATVVDVGTNNTTFAPTYTQITLTGGARSSSDYVRLGTNLLPDNNTPVTIELWATQKSIQNWSRIFDFGADTSENLLMSWTKGTTLSSDRVEWKDAATNTSDNTNQPYTLNTEYHIVMVLTPLADSTTEVKWYSAPSANTDLGSAKGSFISTNNLANFTDSEDNLGRSFYSDDNTANASYNEVRFWSGLMNSAVLEALHDAGPNANLNALSAGGSLPAATAVDITGSGAALNLNNINQTIGSLSGVSGSSVLLGAATLTTGGNGGSTTFSGVISGSGGVIKTGSGTITLAGANTYSGATSIGSGVLEVKNATALGNTTGGATVQNGASLLISQSLTIGNESLSLSGGGALRISNSAAVDYGGAITLADLTSIKLDANTTLHFTNAAGITAADKDLTIITDDGAVASVDGIVNLNGGALTKNNSGALILTGSTVAVASTLLAGGSLEIDSLSASMGDITGDGALIVGDGVIAAQVTTNCLAVSSLQIRAGAKLIISGITEGAADDFGPMQPVPEPASVILLIIAGLLLLAKCGLKKITGT